MADFNFDPFGFSEIRKEQEKFRKEAKQTFVNGIDPADLKIGMRVTISPNLRQGDRSYCTELLEVQAFNACHVQLRFLDRKSNHRDHIIIVCAEHHIYSAEDFQPVTS